MVVFVTFDGVLARRLNIILTTLDMKRVFEAGQNEYPSYCFFQFCVKFRNRTGQTVKQNHKAKKQSEAGMLSNYPAKGNIQHHKSRICCGKYCTIYKEYARIPMPTHISQ